MNGSQGVAQGLDSNQNGESALANVGHVDHANMKPMEDKPKKRKSRRQEREESANMTGYAAEQHYYANGQQDDGSFLGNLPFDFGGEAQEYYGEDPSSNQYSDITGKKQHYSGSRGAAARHRERMQQYQSEKKKIGTEEPVSPRKGQLYRNESAEVIRVD